MPEYNYPVAQIEIDGVSWEDSGLGGMLQSIDIEDEEGTNVTARVTISGLTMDEMSSGSFKSGVIIRVKLGYIDEMYDSGVFRVSKPQYTPGPGASCSVVLEGQGGGSGAPMAYIQVNESYGGMTVREIVEDIASRFGLRTYFGQSDSPRKLVGHSYVSEDEYIAPTQTLAIEESVVSIFETDYSSLICEDQDSEYAPEPGQEQVQIPVYEGGEPDIDIEMGSVLTAGRNLFEFLKDLAESCGRLLHIADGVINFRRLEDQPWSYGLTDPENTVVSSFYKSKLRIGAEGSGFTYGRTSGQGNSLDAIQVRQFENATGISVKEPLSEINQAQLIGAFGVVENTEPIHFLYGRDPDQDGQFNIWSLRIIENYRNKAGKVEASNVDENSVETITAEGEPEAPPWWALGDLGQNQLEPGSEGEGVGGNPNFGWHGVADEKLSVSKTPETAQERQAEKSKYQQTTQAIGTGPDDASAEEDGGFFSTLTQTIADAVADGDSDLKASTLASIDDMLGVSGTPDELQTAVSSAASADMYGTFLEFTSYGQPGAKAQRTVYMEELGRWAGKTYLRSVRHSYSTGGYFIHCKVRAPGSLGSGAASAATDGLDNTDAAIDGVSKEIHHQLTNTSDSDVWAGAFETRSGSITDE